MRQDESMLKIDIHKSIPELLLDNTDQEQNFSICIYRK